MAAWPTCGQSGYVTPALLGVPNAQHGDKNWKWPRGQHDLCCVGGPQRGVWGQKSEIATWPTCGENGYITPAVLGVPIANRGDKNQQCLRGPHVGKVATSPLMSWWSPALKAGTSSLPSWGSPTLSTGTKSRFGYVGHMWAKWLHHPSHLGDPQRLTRGQKSEMATWPTCWQSRYITLAILGVPNAVL